MSKSNGGTRAGNSGNPRGLSSSAVGELPYTPAQGYAPPVSERERDLEEQAERLYAARALLVDPGDAVFEQARNLGNASIELSIENTTDYIAQVVNGSIPGSKYIRIQSKTTPDAEMIREYGTEMVDIPMESRSLMDIIRELRAPASRIFNKYR